jgi:RNA polymerase sigma factor (sigma-70 family)
MAAKILPLDSELRLLERIAAGDETALVALYDANRRPVRNYILRNNGTVDDADDMLQEALVVLWERVRTGKFELRAHTGTFIYAIVRNLWLRRLARARREPAGTTAETAVSSDAPSPVELLMEQEEAGAIRDALDTLGDPCRRLLVLYYWEEMSMERIAVAMGFANADTVKSKKYQCKKSLEQILRKAMR